MGALLLWDRGPSRMQSKDGLRLLWKICRDAMSTGAIVSNTAAWPCGLARDWNRNFGAAYTSKNRRVHCGRKRERCPASAGNPAERIRVLTLARRAVAGAWPPVGGTPVD